MVNLSFSQVAAMNEHFVLHTFSSFLDSAERSGIRKIELWAGLPHLYAPDTTPQKVNDIARQLRRRQIELICYTPEQCVYPFNIAAKDPELQKYSLEYFLRNLKIARIAPVPDRTRLGDAHGTAAGGAEAKSGVCERDLPGGGAAGHPGSAGSAGR